MSSNLQEKVDLGELSSLLVQKVLECCVLIHQSGSHADIMMKQGDDPVTQIDYRVQAKLIQAIHSEFPTINIVGEEDAQTMKKICEKYLDETHLPREESFKHIQVPHSIASLKELPSNDLCIWIDPLDCTRGFVNNFKYECTVLVGVTYKGQPILGVIGQPYKRVGDSFDYKYSPTVNIGCVYSKGDESYQFAISQKQWKILSGKNEQVETPTIAVSSRRQSTLQQDLLNTLGAKEVKTGGAGQKMLLVIRGQIDAMMFLGVSTSKWDSCAGEAIVRSMGGSVIQPDLTNIPYCPFSSSHTNKLGFVATTKHLLFEKIHEFLEKENQ